jgi:hypothetical protein
MSGYDVGQVVNLRRVGNPPGRHWQTLAGGPIDNRPQVDNLPHKGASGLAVVPPLDAAAPFVASNEKR